MRERIRDGLLAGLGIVSLRKKEFQKVYQNLIKEGKEARDKSEFLKRHWNRLDTFSEEFEGLVAKIIEKANLVTRTQIDKLNEKIDGLIKETKSR